jgi:hypothetical protein
VGGSAQQTLISVIVPMNTAIEVFIGLSSIYIPCHTPGSVFNHRVVAFTHASLTLWLHDHAHFVTLAVFDGFAFDETIGVFTFDWLALRSSPRLQARRSS